MKIIIETERLQLRKFNTRDAKAVLAFNGHPEVQKYTGDSLLKTIDEAQKIITDIWLPEYEKYSYARWAVIYKPEQKVIGFAGLKYLPEIGETDIGYRFLPDYWGKGIATEVSKEIIKYGFEVLGLKKIIGIIEPSNVASEKVLEKIGLHFYKRDEYGGDGGQYKWYKIENIK